MIVLLFLLVWVGFLLGCNRGYWSRAPKSSGYAASAARPWYIPGSISLYAIERRYIGRVGISSGSCRSELRQSWSQFTKRCRSEHDTEVSRVGSRPGIARAARTSG